MQLLPLEKFAHVFEPLAGQTVGVVDGWGNVGDLLLYAATRQLLRAFGICWQTFNPLADAAGDMQLDSLLLFAGGSMGSALARPARVIREAALATGLPCIVLPQSFQTPEPLPYTRVYVRERVSLTCCPNGILAPDLALGYDFPSVPAPVQDQGVFLRLHGESCFPARAKIDPAVFCHSPQEYIAFVAHYQHIVTDRLHLAITALGLKREVTLLPVAYHKNRSMWETWLRDLGCKWAKAPL
jgi:hypothetical protein